MKNLVLMNLLMLLEKIKTIIMTAREFLLIYNRKIKSFKWKPSLIKLGFHFLGIGTEKNSQISIEKDNKGYLLR